MARYAGAQQRDLGKGGAPLVADDLVLCLHTMAGNLTGTDAYFRTVGVFSHFGIGGTWGADATRGLDGVVYQWGDTALRAAANLDGNRRVISVETADNAVRPIQPWTARQQTAIVNLMVWAHRTHGIPLVLIPDSKPGRRGVAFHRLGCPPYMVAGGELWTSSQGKDCPTQARIDQIPALVERAVNIVNGGTDVEDDMFEDTDRAKLDQLHRIITQNNTAGDVNSLVEMVTKLGTEEADRDARILGRLDSLSLPSFTDQQVTELAAALDLDEDAVAAAVRRDLAEALSGPAA